MTNYNAFSDGELLFLLKDDDEKAMAEIYERYWDKLLAVALNRLSNLEEAQECVQDVFIRVWKLRKQLQLKYSLYTYLSAAVRYRVLDLLDKQFRNLKYASGVLLEMIDLPAANTESDRNILEKELMEHIESSINKLPEKCRIVYRMSRDEDKSNKHIATELGIAEKTVEAHITKAIKQLRDNLNSTLPVIILICFHNIHQRF